jgi:hypothetical protein
MNLQGAAKQWPTPAARHADQGENVPDGKRGTTMIMAIRQWATPQAHDTAQGDPDRVGRFGTKHGGRNLTDDVTAWATPNAHDRAQTPRQVDHGIQLANQVANWPTPTVVDYKSDESRKSTEEIYKKKGRPLRRVACHFSPPAPPTPDGPQSSKARRTLNPLFVEWLMGWPSGWTDCDSAATGLSHYRQRMRIKLSTLCSRPPAQASLL